MNIRQLTWLTISILLITCSLFVVSPASVIAQQKNTQYDLFPRLPESQKQDSVVMTNAAQSTNDERASETANRFSVQNSLSCRTYPQKGFYKIWSNTPELKTKLRCPHSHHPRVSPEVYDTRVSYQKFNSGYLLWVEKPSNSLGAPSLIYFVRNNGAYQRFFTPYNISELLRNNLTPSSVSLDNWREEQPDLYQSLRGEITARQIGNSVAQDFEGGKMIWLPQINQTIVFIGSLQQALIFNIPFETELVQNPPINFSNEHVDSNEAATTDIEEEKRLVTSVILNEVQAANQRNIYDILPLYTKNARIISRSRTIYTGDDTFYEMRTGAIREFYTDFFNLNWYSYYLAELSVESITGSYAKVTHRGVVSDGKYYRDLATYSLQKIDGEWLIFELEVGTTLP